MPLKKAGAFGLACLSALVDLPTFGAHANLLEPGIATASQKAEPGETDFTSSAETSIEAAIDGIYGAGDANKMYWASPTVDKPYYKVDMGEEKHVETIFYLNRQTNPDDNKYGLGVGFYVTNSGEVADLVTACIPVKSKNLGLISGYYKCKADG